MSYVDKAKMLTRAAANGAAIEESTPVTAKSRRPATRKPRQPRCARILTGTPGAAHTYGQFLRRPRDRRNATLGGPHGNGIAGLQPGDRQLSFQDDERHAALHCAVPGATTAVLDFAVSCRFTPIPACRRRS